MYKTASANAQSRLDRGARPSPGPRVRFGKKKRFLTKKKRIAKAKKKLAKAKRELKDRQAAEKPRSELRVSRKIKEKRAAVSAGIKGPRKSKKLS